MLPGFGLRRPPKDHFRVRLRELAKERQQALAEASGDHREQNQSRWLSAVLLLFRYLLFSLDRFLRPVLALATLLAGFSLVMLGFYAQSRPQLIKPAEEALYKMSAQLGVQAYVNKVQKLGGLVTRNAELTMVRDNLERTRLMLEAYPVEGGHVYPMTVDMLYNQASSKGFWSLSRNPLSGAYSSYRDILANYSDYEISTDKLAFRGKVLYLPNGHPPSTYRLYACDKEGKLIQTQAGAFYLTNEK